MTDDAELVLAARAGERDAFAALVDRWFDRCWEVAWRILHDRDLAADVAQDTLLVAWRRVGELDRPASFGGWVLRIARNRALDRLKRERRMRPTGDDAQLEPDMRTRPDAGPEAALARGQQRDMVWAAAAALGERDASMLDLHLRHGLEPAELADELGMAPNAAHQALFRLRQRLGAAIRAWLLWRNADPTCVVLRAELAAAGDDAFGRATVRLIKRHVTTCEACEDEQSRVAAPAMLFSVVPLVAAPTAARAHALQQLAAAGVPVTDVATGGGMGGGDGADGHGAGESSSGGQSPASAGAAGDAAAGDAAAGAGGGDAHVHAATTTATADAAPAPDGPLPVVRGVPGGGWASGTGRRRLTVLAVTLALVLAAGGWAWSRGRTPPPGPGATSRVSAPAAAPVVSDTPPADPEPSDDAEPPDGPAAEEDDVRATAPRSTSPDPAPSDVTPSEPQGPVAPAPQITLFRVRHTGACADGNPQFELVWASEGADAATLSGPTGPASVQPSDAAVRCAPNGSAFALTVTGQGGTASAAVTATAPPDPPPDEQQPDAPR